MYSILTALYFSSTVSKAAVSTVRHKYIFISTAAVKHVFLPFGGEKNIIQPD